MAEGLTVHQREGRERRRRDSEGDHAARCRQAEGGRVHDGLDEDGAGAEQSPKIQAALPQPFPLLVRIAFEPGRQVGVFIHRRRR
jgi:hypothetical protein